MPTDTNYALATKIITNNNVPPRVLHGSIINNFMSHLLVIGGVSEYQYLCDAHILNFDTLKWTEIRSLSSLIKKGGVTMTNCNNKIIMFGGEGYSSSSNTICELDAYDDNLRYPVVNISRFPYKFIRAIKVFIYTMRKNNFSLCYFDNITDIIEFMDISGFIKLNNM